MINIKKRFIRDLVISSIFIVAFIVSFIFAIIKCSDVIKFLGLILLSLLGGGGGIYSSIFTKVDCYIKKEKQIPYSHKNELPNMRKKEISNISEQELPFIKEEQPPKKGLKWYWGGEICLVIALIINILILTI